MWSSSITSSIYRIIMPLCQKFLPNKKESETKKEHKKQTHGQVLILTCLDLYTKGIYAWFGSCKSKVVGFGRSD